MPHEVLHRLEETKKMEMHDHEDDKKQGRIFKGRHAFPHRISEC
jgi:hypothetical protein